MLEDLYVPFMFSSPHSYNISWLELLFGSIKTGILNPDLLPVGKSNFVGIVKMVLHKIKLIPRH